MFVENITTAEGFEFNFEVNNEGGHCTYFRGRAWSEFVKTYNLKRGQDLFFNMDKHGATSKVSCGNLPITNPGINLLILLPLQCKFSCNYYYSF